MKWKPRSRKIQALRDAISEHKGKVEIRMMALSWATSYWLRDKRKSWTSPE